MNKSLLGVLAMGVMAMVPAVAFAAIPTLTVSPNPVDQGQTLTMTLSTNDGRTWPTVWFTKGTSETALSSTAFPCYQMCFAGRTVTQTYLIPASWVDATDYYAKVYDHVSDQYIKTNFSVGLSGGGGDPTPVPGPATVTISPQTVRPGQVMTISLETNGARTWPDIWFTKGTSAQQIAQTSFPCDFRCTEPTTAQFTIPKWKNGNYYVNVYDETNAKYIKVGFTVRR
jgi:hypothetical protein